MVALGIMIALISYGLTFTATNFNTGNYKLKYDVFPVNIYYNLRFAIQKWNRSILYPLTSKDFKFNSIKKEKADNREIYVLVIGEAGRAGNWSLWGYDRETNHGYQSPWVVLYKDCHHPSQHTQKCTRSYPLPMLKILTSFTIKKV